MYSSTSAWLMVAFGACFFSRAHCSFAPSIWRRLLMHAFFCAVVRAFTKLGIAIAARRPMMATTIMISTSVKPLLREVLIFIVVLYFLRSAVNMVVVGLIISSVRCSQNHQRPTDMG